MAVNPIHAGVLPAGFACAAKPVLDKYEQTLYNVCEQYFRDIQKKSNRYPVLSQVRLVDAIKVNQVKVNGIMVNAMSFDIVITDSIGRAALIFECDGKPHDEDQNTLAHDQLKDAIAHAAGIPLYRLKVDTMRPHLAVVRATADYYPDFSRKTGYPTMSGSVVYDLLSYPDSQRTLEVEDLELLLIKAGWTFPGGWEYVTSYELREFLKQGIQP